MIGMGTSKNEYSHTTTLLNRMPFLVDDVPAWFHSLSDSDFDHVCVSAVTIILVEEQDETGFTSATSISRLMRGVRDRYRQIRGKRLGINHQVARLRGERSPTASLNEWQVRVARRMSHKVSSAELAKLFGVNASTLRHARSGLTWQYLSNGNGLSLNQHCA